MSRALQFQRRERTHLARRGGRRTRTLVQAVYGRGIQPVECPRKTKKPPEVSLGRLSFGLSIRPSHGHPTGSARIEIRGGMTAENDDPGKAHTPVQTRGSAFRRARGSVCSHVDQACHGSLFRTDDHIKRFVQVDRVFFADAHHGQCVGPVERFALCSTSPLVGRVTRVTPSRSPGNGSGIRDSNPRPSAWESTSPARDH